MIMPRAKYAESDKAEIVHGTSPWRGGVIDARLEQQETPDVAFLAV
jgi:hypothetical protein